MFKGEHTLGILGDGLKSWGEGMRTGPRVLFTGIQEERTKEYNSAMRVKRTNTRDERD